MHARHQAWLDQARRDLDAARVLARERYFEQASFYAQQAGEKAVKALLFSVGAPPPIKGPKGHAIGEMMSGFCTLLDDDTLNTAALELKHHEQGSRYPSSATSADGREKAPFEVYDSSTADNAIAHAEVLVRFSTWAVERIEAVWDEAQSEIPTIVAVVSGLLRS